LTPGAKEHFQRLCTLLDELQVPYAVDDKIVRGLDYYHRTVFEVVSEDLGSQGTVGAGGRFDGLIDQMGGPNLPAVGCGTGLERVLQVLLAQKAPLPSPPGIAVYFIPLGEEARAKCLELTAFCRHAGIAADLELVAKKVGSALQNGERLGARFCAIIGSDEIARGTVQLKNLQTREQRQVPFGELLPALQM
jgi:histidyl-tRNA synthetase